MAVQPNLLPSHSEKTLGAMKAERTVKRITFNPSEAHPGETLYVSVPKLSGHEVIVSGSLALVFNIVLTGGHADNYLVQNVSRALVDRLHVKFGAESVQDMDGYDIYKIFEDLFLSVEERANMISEGIQSVDLCQIRSGLWQEKDHRRGCGKQAGEHLQEQVPHPPGPPDFDGSRSLLPAGPLQRSGL